MRTPFLNIIGYLIGVLMAVQAKAQTYTITNQEEINFSNAMYWFDENTGIFGGNQGKMIRTTDAASNFTVIKTPAKGDFSSIHFVNTTTGYACTQKGEIAKSTNGGLTWTSKSIGNVTLKSIRFYDANNGIVMGDAGVCYRTTDGGSTWASKPTNVAKALNGVAYRTATAVMAVGDEGTLLSSTDGGSTWKNVSTSLATTDNLNEIQFTDVNTGFVTGTTKLFTTQDAADSWAELVVGNNINHTLKTYFVNANEGYAVYCYNSTYYGTQYFYKKTGDGGITWSSESTIISSSAGTYLNNFVVKGKKQYVLGNYGYLLSSTDAGITFKDDKTFGASYSTNYKLYSFENNKAFVATSNGGLFSNNGGYTWKNSINITYYKPFINKKTGIGFAFESYNGYKLYKTTNFGETWDFISSPSVNLDNFSMPDANTLVANSYSDIYRSTDGGLTFNKYAIGTSINGISFSSAKRGWLVGSNGLLRKTTNGGTLWSIVNSGVTSTISSVAFLNDTIGYFGTGNSIYKTTDMGVTWTIDRTTDQYDIINDISIYDKNRMIISSTDSYGRHKSYILLNNVSQAYANSNVGDMNDTTGLLAGNGHILRFTYSKSALQAINSPSVEQENASAIFGIYPNPAKDQIQLSAEALEYELCNAQGAVVLSGASTSVINTSTLPKGVYVLKAKTSNGSVVQRFVKE